MKLTSFLCLIAYLGHCALGDVSFHVSVRYTLQNSKAFEIQSGPDYHAYNTNPYRSGIAKTEIQFYVSDSSLSSDASYSMKMSFLGKFVPECPFHATHKSFKGTLDATTC